MASDMKRTVLIVGVCCTVLTLWLVPAEPLPLTGFRSAPSRSTPERQAANEIRAKLREENALLQRLRLVDSLSARLVSSSTGPVFVDLPPVADPEERSMLSEAVRRQVEYLRPGPVDMVVGVSYVDLRFGNHPDYQRGQRSWADYFSGTVDGQSYCLVSYPFRGEDPTNPRSRSNLGNAIRDQTSTRFLEDTGGPPTDLLGPCSFYLVHGAPGVAIRRWLRNDGSRLAWSPWLDGRGMFPPISDHRGPFGEWDRTRYDVRGSFGRESMVGEGCLAGRIDACRHAVLGRTANMDPRYISPLTHPESYIELEEWISSGDSRRRQPFAGRERTWMGDLEAEFGRDRFARFWTSDQTVEDAFTAAFGEPIEVWTMRWAQDRIGIQKAGPSVDLLSVLLTLVALLACIGISTATATRRRV